MGDGIEKHLIKDGMIKIRSTVEDKSRKKNKKSKHGREQNIRKIIDRLSMFRKFTIKQKTIWNPYLNVMPENNKYKTRKIFNTLVERWSEFPLFNIPPIIPTYEINAELERLRNIQTEKKQTNIISRIALSPPCNEILSAIENFATMYCYEEKKHKIIRKLSSSSLLLLSIIVEEFIYKMYGIKIDENIANAEI